jgi:hypothetical protein
MRLTGHLIGTWATRVARGDAFTCPTVGADRLRPGPESDPAPRPQAPDPTFAAAVERIGAGCPNRSLEPRPDGPPRRHPSPAARTASVTTRTPTRPSKSVSLASRASDRPWGAPPRAIGNGPVYHRRIATTRPITAHGCRRYPSTRAGITTALPGRRGRATTASHLNDPDCDRYARFALRPVHGLGSGLDTWSTVTPRAGLMRSRSTGLFAWWVVTPGNGAGEAIGDCTRGRITRGVRQ